MKRRDLLAGIALLPLAKCGSMTPAYATGRCPRAKWIMIHNPTRYREQLWHAETFARREHERLLAEGWQWDGMDGYSK